MSVLLFHPHPPRNPYQEMLYARCPDAGIELRSLRDLSGLDDGAAAGKDVLLHLHWTHTILREERNSVGAEARLGRFIDALDRFTAAGGRLIWTVHNVLPHEARFPEVEAKVCQAIADRAAAVHVMCEATVEAAAAWYEIPRDRVAVIPHASYLGVYPNSTSRDEARERLGLEPGHTVLTVFGTLRRYKGLGRLLDAFEARSVAVPDLRLVIAGRPIKFDEVGAFRARCDRNPAIVAHLDAIAPEEVQLYVNAADAVVLPHTGALNSGLVPLAYSFGRPVIAPDIGCVAAQVPPECGLLFTPGDRDALEQAIARVAELKDPGFGAAALDRARAYPPEAMAADFVALAESVLTEDG